LCVIGPIVNNLVALYKLLVEEFGCFTTSVIARNQGYTGTRRWFSRGNREIPTLEAHRFHSDRNVSLRTRAYVLLHSCISFSSMPPPRSTKAGGEVILRFLTPISDMPISMKAARGRQLPMRVFFMYRLRFSFLSFRSASSLSALSFRTLSCSFRTLSSSSRLFCRASLDSGEFQFFWLYLFDLVLLRIFKFLSPLAILQRLKISRGHFTDLCYHMLGGRVTLLLILRLFPAPDLLTGIVVPSSTTLRNFAGLALGAVVRDAGRVLRQCRLST
jgi:hypothetical protein